MKNNILNQIKDVYSDIYKYEKDRTEINKKLRLLNKHLHCLLEYLRKQE